MLIHKVEFKKIILLATNSSTPAMKLQTKNELILSDGDMSNIRKNNVSVIEEIIFALGFVNMARTSKETVHDD